jgi:diguanylate cyclase (GGDEF)-like protein/PAS domain S-box-containing protein
VEIIEADLEREYRAGQIRSGIWIAVCVTGLAMARIILDWDTGQWWLLPAGVTALIQLPLLWPPWNQLISSRHLPATLGIWGFVELLLLTGFTGNDPAGLVVYPVGAALLLMSAATLASPRAVLALGGSAFVGYFIVLSAHSGTSASLVALTIGLTAAVVWLGANTAGNRRRLDDAQQRKEWRTQALLENASDAVIAISELGEILYASSSVRTVLGYEPGWLNTSRMTAITHPENLATLQEWMISIFESPPGYTTRIEARTRHADGSWIDVEVIGANRLRDPALAAAVLSIRDISARKSLERDLTRQAFEDSLTGMPNRALFHDRTEHALARNLRDGGRVTLLLVDLDDFKRVNDSLGHPAGDHLIATIGARLGHQVRPADTLARLGGDEFGILVEDLNELQATELAERLLAAIRGPVRLGNRDLVCTASIGIAAIKAGERDCDTGALLRDADLAMYAAKAAGRDRFVRFDPTMYADILREADERADIERALQDNEFIVFYQPIVDLPTSLLIGVEALVRWNHPQRGLIGPAEFIPLSEATGLIVPLGRWVMQQACMQLADWCEEFPAAKQMRMSINLSARQFQHGGLVEEVAEALTRSGVDPARIVLEITESLLMQDTEATVEVLRELKSLGIRLAIDDFGTGYSSLSYLKRFPVDIIKIDRAFVEGIIIHGENATLAEAVVQLGQALQLQTVAEGIETDEQWSTLRDLGCDLGQGFLFARPTEPGKISAMLARPGEISSPVEPAPGSAEPVPVQPIPVEPIPVEPIPAEVTG